MTFLHGCRHFCEHADDFRKVLQQDDLKLYRLRDLLELRPLVDDALVDELAHKLGWSASLERAHAYLDLLIGATECGVRERRRSNDSLATPSGPVRWPWPFLERLTRPDRAEWLSAMLGDQGARTNWYTSAGGNRSPD